MFKRKDPYRNGLDTLKIVARETSEIRTLATRRLVRTLEALRREAAERERAEQIDRFRKAGL